MEKVAIKGSYNDNPLNIFISKSGKEVKKVIVFVHGLYGVFDPEEDTDKVNILTKKLSSENFSHCINYNSSRDFEYDSGLSLSERSEAFKNKTFLQELDDLKKVVHWVFDNCDKIFGIPEEELILNIHGNSLGGTLAILLQEFFSKIKKISLCGSGCSTNGSTKPILSTFFREVDVLKTVSFFCGNLLLLQGGEDTTVPQESGLKILKHAIKANRKHIVIPGANHNFSKMYGVENGEVKEKFINTIFDFLSKK